MFSGDGVLAAPLKKSPGCEYSDADNLGPLIPLWETWLRPLAELTGRIVEGETHLSSDPRQASNSRFSNGRLGMSERISGAMPKSVALEYDELDFSRLDASDSDDMKALRVTRTHSRRVFQLTCVRAPTSGTGIRCPE